jgi:hypothetical protein
MDYTYHLGKLARAALILIDVQKAIDVSHHAAHGPPKQHRRGNEDRSGADGLAKTSALSGISLNPSEIAPANYVAPPLFLGVGHWGLHAQIQEKAWL